MCEPGVAKVWWGRCADDIIEVPLETLVDPGTVYAACSGPDSGVGYIVESGCDKDGNCGGLVAGSPSWKMADRRAFGLSLSLYDQNPITHQRSGEPIADTFALCARKNSAVLMIADGVNWGEKAKLAARCATYGGMSHLNENLYNGTAVIKTTRDAFAHLRQAMDAAHATIIAHEGALTTFCAALVLPVCDIAASNAEHLTNSDSQSLKYVICVVNVGDSLAFVFSKHCGLREVTVGSHNLQGARDMRDTGGALGPVNGPNPALDNLTYSLTFAQEGDIVFLATDGITDNFDPVVTKLAAPADHAHHVDEAGAAGSGPEKTRDLSKLTMLPHERHQLALKSMEMSVHEFELGKSRGGCGKDVSAQELCMALMQKVIQLTDGKRRVIEDSALYRQPAGSKLTRKERRGIESAIRKQLLSCPGKLDHATVVAYELGEYKEPATTVCTTNNLSDAVIAAMKRHLAPMPLTSNMFDGYTLPVPTHNRQAAIQVTNQ